MRVAQTAALSEDITTVYSVAGLEVPRHPFGEAISLPRNIPRFGGKKSLVSIKKTKAFHFETLYLL